jgi:hypothetical protein
MDTKTIDKKILISPEKEMQSSAKPLEERQVILHCSFDARINTIMRIWKTTFLHDRGNNIWVPVVHFEGISLYPQWTNFKIGKNVKFTLYFSKLPETCTSFDFFEKIPEPVGFFKSNIQRNKKDVYTVRLFD